MRLRALLFDVDGTLADTEAAHLRAFNAAFRTLDIPWQWSAAEYAQLLTTTGGKERIARYIDALDATPQQRTRWHCLVPLIHSTKTRMFADLVEMGSVVLRPGVARLLREAREAGVLLGIASTTTPRNVEALLVASLGVSALSWFGTIAAGDVVRRKKPASDIYLHALGGLRVAAAEAVAFEDSELGVRAAKGAGLYTIATPTSWTAAQDLRQSDLVLGSLGDPGAPVPAADQQLLGAPWLTLERLQALHAAAPGGVAVR